MSSTVLEMPPVQVSPVAAIRVVPERPEPVVVADNITNNFTEGEVDSLHRDDAMAAGMIAVILGIAFTVLLGLVISVTLWTAMSTS